MLEKSKIIFFRVVIGAILLMFLVFWIIGVLQDIKSVSEIYGKNISLVLGTKAIFYSNNFIRPTLILLAIIGYFIYNTYGWIMICNLFYFIAFQFIFIVMPSSNGTSWYDYFAVLLPLSFIGLMNFKLIRESYNFNPKLIIVENMISIMVALILVQVKGYFHLQNNFYWPEFLGLFN